MAETKPMKEKDELAVILPEKLKITSGWGDTRILWTFRMVTVYEEQQFINRVIATEDEDKAKAIKEYEALQDTMVAFVCEMPIVVKGEQKQPLSAAGDIGAAIREFFKEWSPAKERLINTTLSTYRSAMVPNVSF